jgi:hypothetical protein
MEDRPFVAHRPSPLRYLEIRFAQEISMKWLRKLLLQTDALSPDAVMRVLFPLLLSVALGGFIVLGFLILYGSLHF